MPIEASRAVSVQEDGAFFTLPDAEVDGAGSAGCGGDGGDLATLADDRQDAVPAFRPQVLNAGVQRLGDTQPVQSEQKRQGVVAASSESGLDQEHAEFDAIQAGGVGLVVQPRATDVHRRGHRDQLFFDAVAVEPGNRRQAMRHRGPDLPALFEHRPGAFRPSHRTLTQCPALRRSPRWVLVVTQDSPAGSVRSNLQ